MTPRRLLIPAAGLALSLGCHPSRPVLDPGPTADVGGSISGIAMVDGNGAALVSRLVTAINVDTGQRFDVATSPMGGYTVRVPPGRYRLELELRKGESLAAQPDATEVDAGDLDAGRNFVVTER